MHRFTPVHRWLYGATVGALAALLIAPASSWLLRNQLSLIFGGSTHEFASDTSEAKSRAAERHPNDLQIQLAAAFVTSTSPLDRTPKLRLLRERFADQPALYATILRSAAGGEVSGTHRKEIYLIEPNWQFPRDYKPPVQRPQLLAEFIADAARGEELDPENAYFPFLRSVALFALHKDDEALAAISRAASKNKWEEYVHEEAIGQLRLSESAFGRPPAIVKTALYAAILFPQYAAMRSTAKVAVYRASEAEKAGDIERGIRIRSDLARIGDRMRAHCRSLITALVGKAIAETTTALPAGARVEKRPRESAEDHSNRKREAYYAFLRTNGHNNEAEYLQTVLAAGDGIKSMIQPAIDESAFGGRPMWNLLGLWAANLILLSNALWILLLGGAAAIIARTRSMREGKAMPRAVAWAVFIGVILSGPTIGLLADASQGALESCGVVVLAAVTWLLAKELGTSRALPLALGAAYLGYTGWMPTEVILSTLMLMLGMLLSRRIKVGAEGAPRVVSTVAVSHLCVTGLGTLLLWQTRGIRGMGQIWEMLGLVAGSDFRVASEVSGALFAAIPIVLTALLAVVSRFNRVPILVGIIRGFRGLAAPLACLLLLAYCGTLLATLRLEKFVSDGLDRTLEHEGRYIAGIAGTEWPGVIPALQPYVDVKGGAE